MRGFENEKDLRKKMSWEGRFIVALVGALAVLYVGIGIANKNRGLVKDVNSLILGTPCSGATRGALRCNCIHWPFDGLTLAAVLSMEISKEPFFKDIPEKMVRSGYVMERVVTTGAQPRTNLLWKTVQLFRNGAKERGAVIDAPFLICKNAAIGVWCNGKISVGGEHGWGEGEEGWRSEFWPFPGPWEVRPDLSENSCVMYATTVCTNDVPVSFIVRWNEVFLDGDPNLCATFEVEFFAGSDDLVYRYFEGCGNLAVRTRCKFGVTMNGASWSTKTGVNEGHEIRLKKLGTLAEEKAKRIPELKLTEFEAWYYQIDTELAYEIPPGLLLWFGLCPHDMGNESAMRNLKS